MRGRERDIFSTLARPRKTHELSFLGGGESAAQRRPIGLIQMVDLGEERSPRGEKRGYNPPAIFLLRWRRVAVGKVRESQTPRARPMRSLVLNGDLTRCKKRGGLTKKGKRIIESGEKKLTTNAEKRKRQRQGLAYGTGKKPEALAISEGILPKKGNKKTSEL